MDILDLNYDEESSSLKDINGNEYFKFYAHPNEYLNDHILKTQFVFYNFMDNFTIKSFYNIFFEKSLFNGSFDEFLQFINQIIKYHDIGKISFNFQINRLNKYNISIKDTQLDSLNNLTFKSINLSTLLDDLEIKHSLISSLMFLSKSKNIYSKLLILIGAYVIYGHHTNIKDLSQEKGFAFDLDDISEASLILFLSLLNVSINDVEKKLDFQDFQFDVITELVDNCSDEIWSTISLFYMYLYSLLISADVFATVDYNKSYNYVKLKKYNNRITAEIQEKMFNSFYNKSYNKNLDYSLKFDANVDDINDLRKQMLIDSSVNLNKSLNKDYSKRVFYLNMPTGAGKTNTSMKLALDLIKNTNANRIIYAMPFINIIEQNYDIIKESFGLTEDNQEIRKIYSASETLFEREDEDFKKSVILNDDFFNYPVICTTFVTFFNTIIKNKKKYKYKLFSLVNSVVILDEIQSLPIKNWNSLYYIVHELANKYNIYFIIMSATLPDFDRLMLNMENTIKYPVVSLINTPQNYFNHYLFNRTQIKDFSFLNIEDSNFILYFLDIIKNNFNNNYNKGLIVLNTIKSSKLLYESLKVYKDTYGFKIDLLNSSILPFMKHDIISKINNMQDSDDKYILVSTQSIEAGVDVSFDFVIRDFATIDSIEQVRGRCNRSRELNKKFNDNNKKGNIYLTNIKDKNSDIYKYIFSDAEINSRIKETAILLNKNLDYFYEDIMSYYSNVSDRINNINNLNEMNKNFNDWDNINNFNKCQYFDLMDKNNGINIISEKENQFSIFVAANVPLFSSKLSSKNIVLNNISSDFYKEHKKDFIFSLNEINYIQNLESKYDKKIIQDYKINGYVFLELYKELLDDFKKSNFDQYKIIQKEFSSILNKFIINISSYKDELVDQIESLEPCGFFYILPQDKIGDDEYCLYSITKGFNFSPQICEIW